MKKLLSFFAIAAMLLVVSCNKPQEFLGDEGDLASIHFSVMGDLMTKANSDFATGTKVDKLKVQAFIKGSDNAYHLTNANITITPVTGASPLAWDVDMKLAKNRDYKIAFFAYKDGTGIYGVDDLSAITVDYSKIAINSDDADAFCAARSLTVAGALSETVELYRPLAQLNIGVSDWEEYKNSTLDEMQDITVAITVNSVPNGLNLIGGETAADGSVAATVSGENTVEFARVDVLDVDDELVTGYDYFSMVYVLASKDKENMTFTADFEFGDETSVDISNIEITNMPYQANYRTNVLGQLLTGNIHYDVEIVPGFMTPDYEKLLAPEFASVAALNAYFETMADNSDDGDVEPEVVSLSAVADGDIIKLPKIAGGVVIRVNAVCDGTLTVQYADGASDTQKPANVYLYVKKATNLVVNLPASHVELIDDSWVTGTITATTSGDTFVVGGKAKVGKVEIKQGNTEIAGKVNNVEVLEDATADGTNPVEVFLAKESAVTHIDLNAPANVVVEQPADNIDKAATENKVSVDVNVNGCSATAQNGGQIYVNVKDGFTCEVTAEKDSAAKIVDEGDGVTAIQNNGGQVVFDEGANVTVYNDPAAKIGDTVYPSIAEALAAVPTTDVATTIKLVANATINEQNPFKINKNQNVVLDLNGKTINHVAPNAASAATFTNYGTFTVDDTVGGGKITMTGTPDSSWLYGIYTIDNRKTLVINGGTIENASGRGLGFAVHTGAYGTATNVTVNGGVITHPNYCAFCIYYQQSGKQTVVINDAKIIGSASPIWYQICTNNPDIDMTINGGEVESTNEYAPIYVWAYNSGFDATNVKMSITGGNFVYGGSDAIDWSDEDSAFVNLNKSVITGGTFSDFPLNCVADGYAVYTNNDGETYAVFPMDNVPEGYKMCIVGGGASIIDDGDDF